MLAVVAAAAAGVVGLATSAAYRLHGPVVALRQLDLLYLDEPAPLADQLGIKAGSPTLLVICRSCRPSTLRMFRSPWPPGRKTRCRCRGWPPRWRVAHHLPISEPAWSLRLLTGGRE